MRTFVSGGGADYLSGLRDAATALADGAGEFAYQLDYTNLMIVLQVVAFLAEWAVTLVMWSWNPIGAAIEQAFLEELFKVLFGSTLRRFLTHAAMTVVTNLALSTALDGLARWVLALKGEHTTQGDEYRHSAVLSGAVQGAFGAAVPLLTGPVKKLISKGFTPAAVKAMQESIENALTHPGAAAPVKSAAADVAKTAGSDVAKSAGPGVNDLGIKELGVLPGGADRELAGLGNRLGPKLAALVVPMRVTLLHDVASAKAQNTFRAAVAQQFTTAFATSLGTDTAHTMGMAWANAFLTHAATGKNLAPALKTALLPMDALGSHYTPLRTALSDKVAAALPSAWKDKPAHLLIDTAFSAGHQNLSEGIVNYIEQGTFTTTKETTIGAMGGDILGHAKHPILTTIHTTLTTALHLNLKIPSLLTTPPTTSINTATADTLTTPPTTNPSATPTPTPTTSATTLPTTTDTTAFTPLPTTDTNINVPTPNSPNSPNTLQPTPTPATGTPTPAPTRTTPNATTDTTTPPTRITTTSSGTTDKAVGDSVFAALTDTFAQARPAPDAGALDEAPGWSAARATAAPVTRRHEWTDPVSRAVGSDGTPLRYVVRSGFDVRRFDFLGHPVTDVTIRVHLAAADDVTQSDVDAVWQRAHQGVRTHFNDPAYRLPDGELLHVTLERSEPSLAHMTVTVGRTGSALTQRHWPADATEKDLAHEAGHQMGLRDEYPDRTAPQRPAVEGSLMGAYETTAAPGLLQSGLRGRHLHLLAAQIGEVPPGRVPSTVRPENESGYVGGAARPHPEEAEPTGIRDAFHRPGRAEVRASYHQVPPDLDKLVRRTPLPDDVTPERGSPLAQRQANGVLRHRAVSAFVKAANDIEGARRAAAEHGGVVPERLPADIVRDLPEHTSALFPELRTHVATLGTSASHPRAAAPSSRVLTHEGVRLNLQGIHEDDPHLAPRVDLLKRALSVLAAAGFSMPPHLTVLLPRYSRTVHVAGPYADSVYAKPVHSYFQESPVSRFVEPDGLYLTPLAVAPLSASAGPARFQDAMADPVLGQVIGDLVRVLHHRNDPALHVDLNGTEFVDPQTKQLIGRVSELAQRSPQDFVSEFGLGLALGRTYESPELERALVGLHRRLGGPLPTPGGSAVRHALQSQDLDILSRQVSSLLGERGSAVRPDREKIRAAHDLLTPVQHWLNLPDRAKLLADRLTDTDEWDRTRAAAVPVPASFTWVDPVSRPGPVAEESGPLPDPRFRNEPRYAVSSSFDIRRFRVGEDDVTDLTVRIRLRGDGKVDESQLDEVWRSVLEGVDEVYNAPRHRLPGGDLLHVTLERVRERHQPTHLKVRVDSRVHRSNQRIWSTRGTKLTFAHEVGHQIGLRDEYASATAPQRPGVVGSLMGDLFKDSPDGLRRGGMRDRYLRLIQHQIDIALEQRLRPATTQQDVGTPLTVDPQAPGTPPVEKPLPPLPATSRPLPPVPAAEKPLPPPPATDRPLPPAPATEATPVSEKPLPSIPSTEKPLPRTPLPALPRASEELPLPPVRMTVAGQIGGADRVLPSPVAADAVTRDVVARLAGALDLRRREELRADWRNRMRREIWPWLSAMTRGQVRTITMDAAGLTGKVSVRARVVSAATEGSFRSIEFEDGSESQVRDGFQREVRSAVTAGLLVKGKPAEHTDLTGHLSSNWSRTEAHRVVSSGRLFSRTKTPEAALRIAATLQLEFDFSAVRSTLGRHFALESADGERVTRVQVTTTVPVASGIGEAEPLSADRASPLYRPPLRVEQTLALGGMDTVRDVFLVDAVGERTSGVLHTSLLGSADTPASLEAYGQRTFGDDWGRIRNLLIDRIGSWDVLQYALKGLTAGETMEIDLGKGRGSLLVTAEIVSMRHVRNTAKTEFNSGSDITRVFSHAKGSEQSLRVTALAQSADLKAGPASVTGNVYGEYDQEGTAVGRQSVRTGLAIKMKVPGAVFDGVAALGFTHRPAGGGEAAPNAVALSARPMPKARARIGFQVLVDAADARAVPEPAPFSAAERPPGPRRMTGTPLRSEDTAWRPAPEVWAGLPAHTVVLDVLSGEEPAHADVDAPRLGDLVDSLGRDYFGDRWATVRPAAHNATAREQLAVLLPQATRGTTVRGVPLPTPLRADAHLSLRGSLESLEYLRVLDAAEINLLSDVTGERGSRLGSAVTHGQWVQGGVQPDLTPEVTLTVHAPGGGIAHRYRTGAGSSAGHSSVASAKYPEPMVAYIATVGLDVGLGVGDDTRTHEGRTRVRLVVALPRTHTRSFEVGPEEAGPQVFTRPAVAEAPAPHVAPTELAFRPPARVTGAGRIGNADVVVELPKDPVVHEVREQLSGAFGTRWDQVESEVAQFFDSVALQPRIAALTSGESWGGVFKAGPVTAAIRITAARAEMTRYVRVENDFEFEQGTESAGGVSNHKDAHVRRTLWERAGVKVPHLSVVLGQVRHQEFLESEDVDTHGGVVSKDKTVEPAALFEGRVTYTVEADLSHVLPGAGEGRRVFTVVGDGTFAFPVRDLPVDPTTGRPPAPERPHGMPERIERTRRLGADDVVLDVGPLAGEASSANLVEDVLRQLDGSGPRVFGSGQRWQAARRKLGERLSASEFHRRLKSMMAGQPWVVRVDGRELAITAGVQEMTHIADTRATEFHSVALAVEGAARTGTHLHGPQVTSRGTNVTVVGTSDPIGSAPAEIFAGGTLAHTTQDEDFADTSAGVRFAAGTKTKVPGSVFDGVARLRFASRDRRRLFGHGVDRRIPEGTGKEQREIGLLRDRLSDARDRLDAQMRRVGPLVDAFNAGENGSDAGRSPDVSSLGRELDAVRTLRAEADALRAEYDSRLLEQTRRIRASAAARLDGTAGGGFPSMTRRRFGVRVRGVGEAEIAFRTLVQSADTTSVPEAGPAGSDNPVDGTVDSDRGGTAPQAHASETVPLPPESLWSEGLADGQLVRDLPDVGSLRDLLDAAGRAAFGGGWTHTTRVGRRRGDLVQADFSKDRLTAALPHLTRGGELRSSSFRVNGREAWVSARAELLDLTHTRPEPQAEVVVAEEKFALYTRRGLHSRQFFLVSQFGALASALESKLGAALTFGGGFRHRSRADQVSGGRVFVNAKIPTPLEHFDGHVKFTFAFHHGGTTEEAAGVVPVGISVPTTQITAHTPAGAHPSSSRPTEPGSGARRSAQEPVAEIGTNHTAPTVPRQDSAGLRDDGAGDTRTAPRAASEPGAPAGPSRVHAVPPPVGAEGIALSDSVFSALTGTAPRTPDTTPAERASARTPSGTRAHRSEEVLRSVVRRVLDSSAEDVVALRDSVWSGADRPRPPGLPEPAESGTVTSFPTDREDRALPSGLENIPGLLDIGRLRKLTDPGSGPGSVYENDQGERFYVEERPSADHVRDEVLAASLYGLSGVEVPPVLPTVVDGRPATAVVVREFQDDLKDQVRNSRYRAGIHEGFATDAWLGNQGLSHSIVTVAGKPFRGSSGGVLFHRFTGEVKGDAFGTDVTEWDTLRDPEFGEEDAALFSDISRLATSYSVERVVNISAEAIGDAVDAVGFAPEQAEHLKHLLRERQADLARRQLRRIVRGTGSGLENAPGVMEFTEAEGAPAYSDPHHLHEDGEGSIYRKDGEGRFYVESKPSADFVRNQVLAAKLYRLAAVPAPDIRFAVLDGKPAVAFPVLDGTMEKASVHDDETYRTEARTGFAADAWLGNSDPSGDIVVANGEPVRAHVNDILLYRPRGVPAGISFGADVREWQTLRDPRTNRRNASVFAGMTEETRRDSVERLLSIPGPAIDEAVDSVGFGPVRAARLKQLLRLRRDDLAAKAGVSPDMRPRMSGADLVAGTPRRAGWLRALPEEELRQGPPEVRAPDSARGGLGNIPGLLEVTSTRTAAPESVPSGHGYLHEDHEGNRFHMEVHPSAEQVRNDVLAAKLYRLTGVDVLPVRPAVLDGMPATAVEIPEFQDDSEYRMRDSRYRARAQSAFATDAWLGQSSFPGFVTVDGMPVRVAVDGALLFRSGGAAKEDTFGTDVREWESLRDPGVNQQGASLFSDMGQEALRASLRNVLAVPADAVDAAVDSVGFGTERARQLKELLHRRRDGLSERVDRHDTESTPGLLRFTSARKVEAEAGDSPGNMYETADGDRFYVQPKPSADHVRNEVLVAKLYRLTDVAAPDVRFAVLDGGPATAIAARHGAVDLEGWTKDSVHRAEVQKGFATDAWLGNEHVARGVVIVDGLPVRAFSEGALLYRLTGTAKGLALGADVTEWESLRDPGVNVENASLFSDMSEQALRDSVRRVLDVPGETLDATVDSAGFGSARAAWLKDLLRLRRDDLAGQAGLSRTGHPQLEETNRPDGPPQRPGWLRTSHGRPADHTRHLAGGAVESSAPMPVPALGWHDGTGVRLATGHDLMVAHWLSAEGSQLFDTEMRAELNALTKAQAYARGNEALESLWESQERTLAQNAYLFRFLENRHELRMLGEQQLAAVVMAERQGLSRFTEDRQHMASDVWLTALGHWAKPYAVAPGRTKELVESAQDVLREDMLPIMNIALNSVLPDGGSVLDSMLERSDGDNRVLRNLWEIAYHQEDPEGTFADTSFRPQPFREQLHARGVVEEFLGYAATLRRTREAGGNYDSGRPGWKFAPQDLTQLPVYGSLTSRHRPHGLPAYGTAIVHFKRDVLQRATFTPQDSLLVRGEGPESVVTGQGNMLPLLRHGQNDVVRLVLAEATDFAYDSELRGLRDRGALEAGIRENAYIEVQINGDVTWGDLDRIILVDEGGRAGEGRETVREQKRRLERFARERGHPFTVEIQYPRPQGTGHLYRGRPDSVRGDHFEDRKGRVFHVRPTASDDVSRNEIVAARLYRLAGIPAAGVRLALLGGHLAVMSDFWPGARTDLAERRHDREYRAEIQQGFAADAWLANWNVAGAGWDNILTSRIGPVRINTGMTLLNQDGHAFGDDALGPDVVEWETLRDPETQPESSSLFSGMSQDVLRASVRRVLDIPDEDIDTAVDSAGFDPGQMARLKDVLHRRRADLAARAGVLWDRNAGQSGPAG
ncbi:hypothetical protein ABTY96_45310 [Streptomyces sp. NPDC096057]|uniref:hypothetical protein n=1 Tax=Streptomyces sp. NPDC096057 TaxID=3155543 RepID=UPI003323E856